jgi:hypothetical protein
MAIGKQGPLPGVEHDEWRESVDGVSVALHLLGIKVEFLIPRQGCKEVGNLQRGHNENVVMALYVPPEIGCVLIDPLPRFETLRREELPTDPLVGPHPPEWDAAPGAVA